MYAIVEIAGQQMKVEKGRKIYVHRLENAEGETVVFDKVLLVDDEGAVKVGTPVVEGASVTATVVEHVKGDKVLVFKKKRRKGYQKQNGHRQYFSEITIDSINLGGKSKAAPAPKAAKAVEITEAPVVEANPTQEEN